MITSEKLIQIVNENKINTYEDYKAKYKKLKLPLNPYRYFKGWSFNNILSFEDARRITREKHFKNYKEFQRNVPKGVSSNPKKHYKKDWISYSDFLGLTKLSTRAKKFPTYDEAKEIVKTSSEYLKLYKKRKLPLTLPRHPEQIYGKKYGGKNE